MILIKNIPGATTLLTAILRSHIAQARRGRKVYLHTFSSKLPRVIMSEERSRISLRSGGRRKAPKPTISAPKQISGPILQDGSAKGGAPLGGAADMPQPRPRLRPPPMAGGKVGIDSDPAQVEVESCFTDIADRHPILSNKDILLDSTISRVISTRLFQPYLRCLLWIYFNQILDVRQQHEGLHPY